MYTEIMQVCYVLAKVGYVTSLLFGQHYNLSPISKYNIVICGLHVCNFDFLLKIIWSLTFIQLSPEIEPSRVGGSLSSAVNPHSPNILYSVGVTWSLLTTRCTMFGVLQSVLNPNCSRFATEDAVRIGNSFIYNPNHTSLQSQLFITLLRIYTIIILTHS
jgi:hypothetical protein